MKKFIKAVKEYIYYKNQLKCPNTYLIYDPCINNYIVSIHISKEYIKTYHFINVY